MLEAFGTGFVNVFNPLTLIFIFLGVIYGLIVGILPGFGGPACIAILLPLIYGLDPAFAMSLLIAIHAVVYQGGLITSVLFGIPGESTTTATILDGYPMAKQGKAGRALASGQMASLLGGIFGGLVLAAGIPVIRPIVLAFGSPELFMLAILGISLVAVIGRGSALKALIAGTLGLFLSSFGLHYGTNTLRFTGNFLYLWEGIKVIPMVIGLFAVPEVIDMAVSGGTIAKVGETDVKYEDIKQGIKDVFQHWWLVIRCSVIGTGVGIIPGVGGVVAQFLCYGHAKQTSERPEEFGLGCVEGVIAPESANNAKEGGALLTTLSFGIPGSVVMVLIMAALMVLGIKPGPDMLTKHLDLLWTIIITLIFANILGSAIGLLSARHLAKLTFVRSSILVPIILLLVILGAYGLASDIRDVILAFAFGLVGYLMKTFGYSQLTFVLGFILGDYVERYFSISFHSLGPGFIMDSPIALILFALTLLGFFWGKIKKLVLIFCSNQK